MPHIVNHQIVAQSQKEYTRVQESLNDLTKWLSNIHCKCPTPNRGGNESIFENTDLPKNEHGIYLVGGFIPVEKY